MDFIVVFDHFEIAPPIGVVWGEARGRLHQRFTRFNYRVYANNRVKLFVNTPRRSKTRSKASKPRAATRRRLENAARAAHHGELHSGLLGTPVQGFGIVGCGGGAGCTTDCRACDAPCNASTKPRAEVPGFGVVALSQLQPVCKFGGVVRVSVLPLAQLFVDSF
jgi:hypothetical protein